MGLILNLFAVKSGDASSVENVISDFAKETDGFLKKIKDFPEDYGIHMCYTEDTSVCLFTSYGQLDVGDIAKRVSKDMSVPTLDLGIFEGVYWHYNLYADGERKDAFGSGPSQYTAEGETKENYMGNAKVVAEVWGIEPESIENYLFKKSKFLGKLKRPKLAYKDDKFESWDGWQMADFMDKLNIGYPFSEDEETVEEVNFFNKFFEFENKMSAKNCL